MRANFVSSIGLDDSFKKVWCVEERVLLHIAARVVLKPVSWVWPVVLTGAILFEQMSNDIEADGQIQPVTGFEESAKRLGLFPSAFTEPGGAVDFVEVIHTPGEFDFETEGDAASHQVMLQFWRGLVPSSPFCTSDPRKTLMVTYSDRSPTDIGWFMLTSTPDGEISLEIDVLW